MYTMIINNLVFSNFDVNKKTTNISFHNFKTIFYFQGKRPSSSLLIFLFFGKISNENILF